MRKVLTFLKFLKKRKQNEKKNDTTKKKTSKPRVEQATLTRLTLSGKINV